eukprot:gene13295-16211_t
MYNSQLPTEGHSPMHDGGFATGNQAFGKRTLGVRGVHSHLLELGIPLSFLSVREVLKRLCTEGVITLNADKSYSLHEQAAKVLEGRA